MPHRYAISIYILLVSIASLSQSYDFNQFDKLQNDQADCGGKEGGGDSKSCGLSIKDPKAKASSIAQKAAEQAKAANDALPGAAEEAASKAKIRMAEQAMQAARSAEAALAGKQQIFEQLTNEQHEAEAVVQEVTNSMQATQVNAAAAKGALKEQENLLLQLKCIVQSFSANLANLEKVESGTEAELAEKTQLLEAANRHNEALMAQLLAAKQDYEKTKEDAYKALCAAVEAKQKAESIKKDI